MEYNSKFLKDYVESGQYFADAKRWYEFKYIHPFSQRSFVIILTIMICTVFLGLATNIYKLLPIIVELKYSVNAKTTANTSAKIIRADQIKDNIELSVTDIMVRNYVINNENYDYSKLEKQFTVAKNNSTRLVFRRFYEYMNIDNPLSPVMLYQKNATKTSTILSTNYLNNNKVVVKFNTVAKNDSGEILADQVWQATIDFETDKIEANLPSGKRFNFIVTDYQLKLLEDNKK
ncbi:MAG: hypothetical protein EKK61_06135 [Rickettsiales bacterium]|nr:MAG: hypothetical protein EKK61_06135 [Rickettsiales bacterium]